MKILNLERTPYTTLSVIENFTFDRSKNVYRCIYNEPNARLSYKLEMNGDEALWFVEDLHELRKKNKQKFDKNLFEAMKIYIRDNML